MLDELLAFAEHHGSSISTISDTAERENSPAARILRGARRAAELTQAQLAERAGVGQGVISAYERGHREPSFSTLQRLVEASGHAIAWTLEPLRRAPELRTIIEHGWIVRAELASRGIRQARIVGAVARGEAELDTPIELLARVDDRALVAEGIAVAERLFGHEVVIIDAAGLPPARLASLLVDAVIL